jgi:hypothetical protein
MIAKREMSPNLSPVLRPTKKGAPIEAPKMQRALKIFQNLSI